MGSHHMRAMAPAGLVVGLMTGMAPSHATVISLDVTPGSTLAAAVALANADTNLNNEYLIRLAPGTYLNDFAPTITRPMTIEGTGGAANTILQATQALPNQKGILVTIASLTVQDLTFTGAAIGDNGAGIRDQIGTSGSDPTGTLRVLDSIFVGNEEGILTAGSGNKEHVIISGSTFMNNGNAAQNTGQEHGVYIGDAASFDLSNSVFCGTVGQGHNIKSRALMTTITGVTSYEGMPGGGCTQAGNASRGIDIPNGGVLTMDNVALFQGPASANSAMFEFGVEGLKYAVNSAALTNVAFTSSSGGTGIQWYGGTNTCALSGVTFSGLTQNVVSGPAGGTCTSAGDPGGGGTPLPEPGSLGLLLTGLVSLGLGMARRGSAGVTRGLAIRRTRKLNLR